MNSRLKIAAIALSAALISPYALAADAEWMKAVEDALGKTGSAMPGGVYRVGLPRSDIKATLDGVEIIADVSTRHTPCRTRSLSSF